MIRKKYYNPLITVTHIEVEDGLTTSSVNIITGGAQSVQEIENWDKQTFTEDLIF